jgi:hypothetical protein
MEGQPSTCIPNDTSFAKSVPVVAAPAASLAHIVSVTVRDVDELVQTLMSRILSRCSSYYYCPDVKIYIDVGPREQHVLVHAWRSVCERLAPVQLDWKMRDRLSVEIRCTFWALKLDTFEAYAQGRATTTSCAPPPQRAQETGGEPEPAAVDGVLLCYQLDQQCNASRAIYMNCILTKLFSQIADPPRARQDLTSPDYPNLLSAISTQVFDTLLAPRGYSSFTSAGRNGDSCYWTLFHPQGKKASCVVQ